jgi:hypothetical protein
MKSCKSLIAVLTAVTITASVFAQVSPQAPTPTPALSISIAGKITKVEITSSRVYLYVDAMISDNDKPEAWAIETGNLNELSAAGIKRTDLKVGRVVLSKGTPGSGRNSLEAPVSEISFPQ